MTSICYGAERGRAAVFVDGLNLKIIGAAARRAQGHTAVRGARAPASVAGRRVDLVSLVRPKAGAQTELVTPIGYKTAVRAVPRLLSVLPTSDPRRRAADMLAAAMEQIGAVGGGSSEGADTKGGQSDGGVTTRIKHAARLNLAEAVVNGWRVDPLHGSIVKAGYRVALPVLRVRGDRQEIKAFTLLIMICVDGLDLSDILLAHGWKVHSKHTTRLAEVAWAMLEQLATVMFGRQVGP